MNMDMDMNKTDAQKMFDMQMSMGFKPSISYFLLKNWSAKTNSSYFFVIIFTLFLCLLLQLLMHIKELRIKNAKQANGKLLTSFSDSLSDSVLFFMIKFINYIFMLVAMTFNFWVILTMVLGIPFFEFVFSLRKDSQYIQKIKAQLKK